MRILVYGINYAPELTGIGKYTGEMVDWLVSQDHEVAVLTAPPYYPEWCVHEGFNKYWWRNDKINGISVLRCPLFVPKKPSIITRLFHLFSFLVTSFIPSIFLSIRNRPDIVILIVPTLFCAFNALFAAKLSGAKCLLHIQDFETDAMLGISNTPSKLQNVAQRIEKYLLSRFDQVSTISGSMKKNAVQKGVLNRNIFVFPNWTDTNRFLSADTNSEHTLVKLGLPKNCKICLYSGNIGKKQGLHNVILAAKKLQNEDIIHVIVGEGAGLEELKILSNALELDKVYYFHLVEEDQLPSLLHIADCHLVIQQSKVGDAVFPSKLANIFASGGQALITANEGTELYNVCLENPGIAECIVPDNLDALIEGIQTVLQKPKFNPIAQKYAVEHLDKEVVLSNFEKELYKIVENR